MALSIPSFLADLPDLVTPEVLASKLGVKTHTIYQRIWRQKQKPKSTLLPEITVIPGSNRVAFAREVVIQWWQDAQNKVVSKYENQPSVRRRGRPTIASTIGMKG